MAQEVYRLGVPVPEYQLQFNHFLIRGDEPLLFHAGLPDIFPRCAKPSAACWILPSCVGSPSVISIYHPRSELAIAVDYPPRQDLAPTQQ